MCFYIAEPYEVSALDLSGVDYNATDHEITVAWVTPNGSLSGFLVSLLDGTAKVASNETSATNVMLSNGTMKNGYVYAVQIVTKSQTYGNGKYVKSETFTKNIKTDVQGKDFQQFVLK